nr:MAG TPA: hypothetical protein [Caudoviricetes sp.]
MLTVIKIVGFILIVGAMGSLEIDRLTFGGFLMQSLLGLLMIISANQYERIQYLKRQLHGTH